MNTNVQSAVGEEAAAILQDKALPLAERWPVLERAWKRTCHTGYAQVTRRVLKKFYGEEQLTLAALERMTDKLLDLTDPAVIDARGELTDFSELEADDELWELVLALGRLDEVLVGRDDVLQIAEDALDGVGQAESRHLLVRGPLGAGRTRIAREVAIMASGRGWAVHLGRCERAAE